MFLIIWGCSKVDFENGLCNISIYITLHNYWNRSLQPIFCILHAYAEGTEELKIELSTFQDFGIEMC